MFRPEAEAASQGARREVQGRQLHELVQSLTRSKSPFWRERLAGVDPGEVRSVGDLPALPFTSKADLRETYPWGMLAVPRSMIVRVHTSSGASGEPTLSLYTARDVGTFAEVVARSLVCAGARPDDVLQVAYGYGLTTAGPGLHLGGEKLGTTVVPASSGNPAVQLRLLSELAVDGLACTPSYAKHLAERASAEGRGGLAVRYLVCGAEPWSEELRHRLEDAWSDLSGRPVIARDIYGVSEVIGPGIAMECAESPGGLHVFDDHFLPEVLDPETNDPVPDGQRGELVLTTLTKEALPLIRYRTGDVTALQRGTCSCGRTHPRIGRIEGRTDDMVVVRGMNVFPRDIEAVLLETQELTGVYTVVIDRREALPSLEVHVEVAGDAAPAGLDHALQTRLAERLQLRPLVRVHPQGTLPRTAEGTVPTRLDRLDGAHPLGAAGPDA